MPVNIQLITAPIGSFLTTQIANDEPGDKNDFKVFIVGDGNMTGLELSDFSFTIVPGPGTTTPNLMADTALISLTGSGSTWELTIRPPQPSDFTPYSGAPTTSVLTLTLAENATNEGNPQITQTIRISRAFPDPDAENPILLFNHNELRNAVGIAVSPTRIIANRGTETAAEIAFFTHAGVQQTSETLRRTIAGTARRLDYFNGTLLVAGNQFYRAAGRFGLDDFSEIERYAFPTNISNIAHTRFGVIGLGGRILYLQPYGTTGSVHLIQHSLSTEFSYGNITHQDDLLYMADRGFTTDIFALAAIDENDGATYISQLNINRPSGGMRDIALYRDTLYVLGVNNGNIYTLDIKKYRPIAKNTKTTIYPVFAEEGDTIDLKQFSPDAERIVFDVGYDKQPQLSINVSNQLAVGSGAQTCFVKLKAINRISATETESFGFYLIIRRAAAPVWRNVSELTMRAGSSYDLFQLVPDADSIAFRSGRTRLAGSSLSNGNLFRVGTVGGVAAFTARKANRSSHIAITIDVVQGMGAERSEVSGYRVEIAGIDVTADVLAFPSVSETLDPVVINEYRVNEASITLRNAGGKYNSDLAGNFWETNGLNAGGFQNAVKIYLEHSDGSESLHFSGVVNESFVPIKGATFKMNCSDISSRLRKALVQAFGTLEKWDALRKQSDEDSYAGVYVPERSLVPMQTGTGIARSDRTDLAISRLALPSEGPAAENTGYMTPMEFRTAGGFLPENPLLGFMAEHLSEDIRFLVSQLAINKEVYNTEIDIPGVSVEDPFLLNRGSIAFSVEQTRTTRLPVDWVQGVASGLQTPPTMLILLSNPEGHISDQLVQYDVSRDAYRVLHTFDKDLSVHRIERRNATNYYILTSGKITQDRSARELPRHIDATGYIYDSAAKGSEIKIYHYSTSTGTLTEHVAEDDSFPPQLGIHHWVGFENSLYIDEFEGIVADYRGPFKWQSNNLYYRYAKDGEFGIARVNTGGTTTKRIGQAVGGYQDHLNFAFDINSSGAIYFVYATLGVPSDVTVVDRQPLGPGGDITLANNLSGNGTPFRLRLETPGSNYSGAPSVTIVGIDTSGESQTRHVRFTRPGQTQEPTQTFLEITRISASASWVRGNLSVTAIFQDIASQLNIERRTSDGSITTILENQQALSSLTDLDDTGGAYLGCHECVFHNNFLYLLVPIGRVAENSGAYALSREKAAGMVLYRCNVTAGSPSLTVLDKWDFVHQAGCNLTVHDGAVHYVEQPSAATVFKPINPDLDGYWADEGQTQTMGYNLLPESLGALKKINSSGEVEHLGNVWHTDRPYNVFPTRMLSIDGDLHLCAGYGNGDEILRYNSLASAADNRVHIVYGKTLHYVLPRFSPSGSVYAALASLAKSVNATLSFEKNVVMITDRRPYRAVTNGATGTGTGNLGFSDANKAFPSSGYLLIGKEILRYTGITGGAFTGIQRGVLGSQIANHANDSGILYLDTLIQTEKLGSPYKAITLQADVNRIFNIIRDSGGIAEVRDEASINLYGERPYNLDLGLTRHEKSWIEEIFKSYLEELKDLQSIVNLQVRPDFSLRLGQIVPFFYRGLVTGMRIVSVRYERQATHLKGRTVL